MKQRFVYIHSNDLRKARDIIKKNTRYSNVAEYCGCSASHIGNVLNGRRNPSGILRFRIMQVLLICMLKETWGKFYDFMNSDDMLWWIWNRRLLTVMKDSATTEEMFGLLYFWYENPGLDHYLPVLKLSDWKKWHKVNGFKVLRKEHYLKKWTSDTPASNSIHSAPVRVLRIGNR
jgi:hypothetical protein